MKFQKKIKFGNQFEHYLKKTEGLGKRRKLRIKIYKVTVSTQMKLKFE